MNPEIVESTLDLSSSSAPRAVNDQMPAHNPEQVAHSFRDPRIACLGLSFKADVGHLRESPAVDITARIGAALPAVKILAVEPHMPSLPGEFDDLDNVILTDAGHAIADSDVVLPHTGELATWPGVSRPDATALKPRCCHSVGRAPRAALVRKCRFRRSRTGIRSRSRRPAATSR